MELERDLSCDPTNQPTASIEELADDYFASVGSISRNIIRYKQRKLEDFNKDWNGLSQSDKDKVLNEWFLDDGIRLRYEIRLQGTDLLPGVIPESYPKLKVQCGTKTVQYTDSDQNNQVITWRDEFSGPFSWDTKCQQNLGLFGTAPEVSSVQDDCESSMNSSSISADLSSSELFSRVKDISNRLSSGEINIHVNPTFNMDQKVAASSLSRSDVDTEIKGKVTPVVSQPKAAPKMMNGHQSSKSSSGRNDSHNTSVSKPSQPPPVAPGVAKKAHPPSGRAFQLSASSTPTSSAAVSSRPSHRPPTVPPPAPSKPPQPPLTSTSPVATKPSQPPPGVTSAGRPSETPPPPPIEKNLRSQSSPKSPKKQAPQTSLLKSNDRGDEKLLLTSGVDEVDFHLDLDKQQPSSDGDVKQEKKEEEEEQVDAHSGAAFDFLLQW